MAISTQKENSQAMPGKNIQDCFFELYKRTLWFLTGDYLLRRSELDWEAGGPGPSNGYIP